MTVRKQVLDYIRSQKAVSAQEIARAMRMSDANARHHLRTLEAYGVVEVTGERPALDRGRPAKIYSVRSIEAQESLIRSLDILLEELLELGGIELQNQVLRRFADRLAAEFRGQNAPPLSTSTKRINLTQRLNQLVTVFNALNYRARWVARPDSPQIILGQCPYYAIIKKHPELCRIDHYLIEALLGRAVEQEVKLGLDSVGTHSCVFQLATR